MLHRFNSYQNLPTFCDHNRGSFKDYKKYNNYTSLLMLP